MDERDFEPKPLPHHVVAFIDELVINQNFHPTDYDWVGEDEPEPDPSYVPCFKSKINDDDDDSHDTEYILWYTYKDSPLKWTFFKKDWDLDDGEDDDVCFIQIAMGVHFETTPQNHQIMLALTLVQTPNYDFNVSFQSKVFVEGQEQWTHFIANDLQPLVRYADELLIAEG